MLLILEATALAHLILIIILPSTTSSYQDNSSRKGHRSPDHRRIHDPQNNEHNRPRSARSFGHGRPNDERYERRPLAPTNGNRADVHRAPANEFHRNNNTENYANASHGSDMNNMNNYHTHYYPPQSRYEHPKRTSCERRPLSSRQSNPATTQNNYNLSHPRSSSWQHSNPTTSQNIQSAPRFNNNHTIPELSQIAYTNLAAMTPAATAAFWNKVSKQMSGRNAPNPRLPSHHEELCDHLNQIFEHTTRTLSLFGSIDLSQTIYSMAKIVNVLRKHGGRRRGDDIIDMLSSLLLNHDKTPNKELFRSFAIASRDKLHHFDARCLSNITYAYALIKYVPEFDDESDLFDHVATQASQRSAEFNAQDISNMMWAYATVGKPNALLFEAMGDQVVAREHLGEFDPQAISNTAWAYAKAGRVANHIVSFGNLSRFDPQALSNTVWAYAKAGFNNPELFEKIANHIVASDKMDRFDPQNLSSTIWAYATAQVPHLKLFKKVADAAIRSKGEFISQEVANLLWAYATMGDINKQLFLSFASTAAKLIDSYNNQELANVAWAYAVADVDAPSLFNHHFIMMCVEKEDGFKMEGLFQLHQWHLWQSKEKAHPGLPVDLHEACYNEFISEEPTVSKLQEDVVAQLSHIGLEPKEEVLMGSGYRIDALVEVNGKTFGIEVDGPSHFIGRSKPPTGSTILKRRQVPLIDNIELVSVPYWEWDKLGNDEVKKQDYLRVLLAL
ncbi:RAP domain-containing protein [Skeletonema marinoi]|uniref:RAP domain-containing protein n=1 Tax=Skeletonema marinoi TaxID=267567 RepID=A0AAD9D4Y6_9STRA|nr:RAP domain-containing protein [Skeletonema marinoi]